MTERHSEEFIWPEFDYIDGRKVFSDGRNMDVLHKEISTIDDPTDLSIPWSARQKH